MHRTLEREVYLFDLGGLRDLQMQMAPQHRRLRCLPCIESFHEDDRLRLGDRNRDAISGGYELLVRQRRQHGGGIGADGGPGRSRRSGAGHGGRRHGSGVLSRATSPHPGAQVRLAARQVRSTLVSGVGDAFGTRKEGAPGGERGGDVVSRFPVATPL
ncbi:hypothetical protein CISG_01648 [Coccidioides immitis RMSCC 3703]|uniref:Uncharacterized protein n=1 Tax=Coccidioides immitis RMSCC 3703 TaxID=454286 RepID=A0A0J8R4I5_COCIT|nr:hypothetical protein CISG_01648 [Coccidioides immitis RMSCC 3703]